MLFNSLTFVVFFLVVYAAYLATQRSLRVQNLMLLAASYVFYGAWDWRFLSLIAASTLIDYTIGLRLGALQNQAEAAPRRKLLVTLSVAANLGLLGVFKYFNFFADSLVGLLNAVGIHADPVTLRIVLPVGISFYTFQTLSYTIDVYRGRLRPTRNLINFALFVAFFPQLVAGPIERASRLLPQLEKPRSPTVWQVDSGIFLILWGYFKKVVIADRAGLMVDQVFNNYAEHTGLILIVAVLAFAVQIYADFSGYSDIARGLSRLMGIELMVNFKLPYFALNPSDFWQRWHISLSSWLRDYLYIPLGGNRRGNVYRNLMLTMLLGGLWHGAAWNFVIWGGFHGGILILYRRCEKTPMHEDPWEGPHRTSVVLGKMALMFGLTLVGWLIFRATSPEQILYFVRNASLMPSGAGAVMFGKLAFFASPVVVMQWFQYRSRDLLVACRAPDSMRMLIYAGLFMGILFFGVRESIEFIYFQF